MTSATPLMAGKRGLIMGIANERSLAWGVARALRDHGAELAVTWQGEALMKRVIPLAQQLGSSFTAPADVTDTASMDALFARIAEEWGSIDFAVHAVGVLRQGGAEGPLRRHLP